MTHNRNKINPTTNKMSKTPNQTVGVHKPLPYAKKTIKSSASISIQIDEDGTIDIGFAYIKGEMTDAEILGAIELWKLKTFVNR